MKASKKIILAVIFLVLLPTVFLYSEGTKQVMPVAGNTGQLCINKWRSDFAFFDGNPDFRLNISIANTSETIRFGFGQVLDYTSNPISNLTYRIKDPTGTIVSGPFSVPASGNGFINSYAEAVTGPFTGGYNYLEIKPLIIGNYYLEFYYPPAYVDNSRHYLKFFDITVVNAAGKAADGRVWSKAWQLWSSSDPFNGKLMILSDDSIVTQVDCNGFNGGSFSISSNRTGCDITGILADDRMSRPGNHLYPQYKVFLNNPDSTVFPTLTLTSGSITGVAVNPNCTGGADFNIEMVREGTIRILIKNNPAQGTQTDVTQIIRDVMVGNNNITWDGKDAYGNPVPNGTPLVYSVTNLSGMTHLPLYDIENNTNGFIVKQLRPKGSQMKIYWDDTQLGGAANSTAGCLNTGGCHTWSNNFGNNNTINSWWFVTGSEISDNFFVSKKIPGTITISGNNIHCVGTESQDFTIAVEPNSTSYKWNYSGTGVTITQQGTKATLHFAANATPGTLLANGYNADCGDGPASAFDIIFEALPVVKLSPLADICYTAPGFKLSGGQPAQGSYFVHGLVTDSLFPYKEPEGTLPIVYSYTSPTGCSNTDTAEILLYSAPECLGTVFFPNAFTPNGDSLNDLFRPVVQNISSFQMYIFNRWGELLFTTSNVTKGWDGTNKGQPCPAGNYSFVSTYGLSLRTDDIETRRGMFTLIR